MCFGSSKRSVAFMDGGVVVIVVVVAVGACPQAFVIPVVSFIFEVIVVDMAVVDILDVPISVIVFVVTSL